MPSSTRLEAIDKARGVIILLMIIDHARYFLLYQHPAEWWGAELPAYSSFAQFIERGLSHICAPGFFFLMGVSLYLHTGKKVRAGADLYEIRLHFFKRGLKLILLELVAISPVWLLADMRPLQLETYGSSAIPGDTSNAIYYFGVISSLGVSMMLASILSRIPRRFMFMLGIGAIAIAPLSFALGQVPTEHHSIVMRLLWSAGISNGVYVQYPVLPWLGITLLGLVSGSMVRENPQRFYSFCGYGTCLFLATFCLLLFIEPNVLEYGNYSPEGWVGIFNLTKYSPSIGYVLIYLSAASCLVLLLAKISFGRLVDQFLLTLGQAPLIVYVAHLYLLLAVSYLAPREFWGPHFYFAVLLVSIFVWLLCKVQSGGFLKYGFALLGLPSMRTRANRFRF